MKNVETYKQKCGAWDLVKDFHKLTLDKCGISVSIHFACWSGIRRVLVSMATICWFRSYFQNGDERFICLPIKNQFCVNGDSKYMFSGSPSPSMTNYDDMRYLGPGKLDISKKWANIVDFYTWSAVAFVLCAQYHDSTLGNNYSILCTFCLLHSLILNPLHGL